MAGAPVFLHDHVGSVNAEADRRIKHVLNAKNHTFAGNAANDQRLNGVTLQAVGYGAWIVGIFSGFAGFFVALFFCP